MGEVGGGGLADPPVGGDGAVGVDGEPPQATAVVSTAQTTSPRNGRRSERNSSIVAPNGAVELDKKFTRPSRLQYGPMRTGVRFAIFALWQSSPQLWRQVRPNSQPRLNRMTRNAMGFMAQPAIVPVRRTPGGHPVQDATRLADLRSRDWRNHLRTPAGPGRDQRRVRQPLRVSARTRLYGSGTHCEVELDDLEDDECLFGGRWRDVFARWRTFRQAEITAGRFKVPFGREELISFSDTDFAYRALVSTTIPPARDKGVMVNGRFLRRGLTYEVGIFDDDGDNGRLTEPQFAGGDPEDIGPSFAGRVTGTPFRPLSERFETFRLGFAYGLADVLEGLNSSRGQTAHGTDDFFEPVYVKGRRQRVGVEASFSPRSRRLRCRMDAGA